MHQRQAIRAKVVEILSAGVPSVEQRVFPMRFLKYVDTEIPAIGVFVTKESNDTSGNFYAREDVPRTMTLVVEGTISGLDDVENAMDALAEEIELAMDADRTFGGEAADSDHAETELGINTEGEVPTGIVTLTYLVSYYARPSA